MKHPFNIIPATLAVLTLSCSNPLLPSAQSLSIPEELEDYNENCCVSRAEDAKLRTHLAEALRCIANNDAQGFAMCCYYPVERQRPLHDIPDSAAMVKYFDTLFDDSIRNSLKEAIATDWGIMGWRGYMYGNGDFWASYEEGKIMQINYSSPQEQQLRQRMIEADIKSLHPSLHGEWANVHCFRCPNGYVVRLDKFNKELTDKYRLAVFFKGTPLDAAPDLLLHGSREISASDTFYTFSDGKGNKAYFNLVYLTSSDQEPSEFEIKGKRNYKTSELSFFYWDEK